MNESTLVEVDGKSLRLTHLSKVMFPDDGFTKAAVSAFALVTGGFLTAFLTFLLFAATMGGLMLGVSLLVGTSQNLLLTLVVNTTTSGTKTNTAAVASTTTDLFPLNDSDSEETTVQLPEEATEDLIEEVGDLVPSTLSEGRGNSLTSTLESAIRHLEQGRTRPACSQLQAFINEVTAFIESGILTPGEGQLLIDAATAIRTAAGC